MRIPSLSSFFPVLRDTQQGIPKPAIRYSGSFWGAQRFRFRAYGHRAHPNNLRHSRVLGSKDFGGFRVVV